MLFDQMDPGMVRAIIETLPEEIVSGGEAAA